MRGFTLMELVVTLVILGILAVVVLPRLFERKAFDARAFLDEVAAVLRYAQKAAVAQRRTVCAAFTANSVTLTVRSAPGNGTCDTPLAGPAGSAPYTVMAPGGVTFTTFPASLSFDAEGRPNAGATLAVSGSSTTLTVEAETGYVHP